MPMARRIVLAILRWFAGRRPVWLECWMWPRAVVKSEIREKFCRPS